MEFQDKFKKYGGERIPNIIEYLKEYVKNNPSVTISVGCDSSERRRGVSYAITIMMHDNKVKNGAHVVFHRMTIKGKMEIFNRLYKEAEILHELAEFVHENLAPYFIRQDLNDLSIRKYKMHMGQHKGSHIHVDGYDEELLINSISVTDKDRIADYKVCDVHLDFNIDMGDNGHNKSHNVFKATVPWFKSSGYRVWCKPYSHASTSAADLLLK